MCGLGLDVVGIHSLSLAARYRAAACSTTLNQGLEKIQAVRGKTSLLFSLSLLTGRKNFLLLPWLVAPRMLSILFVAWTMMANLMKPRRIKNTRLPLDYSVTNYMSRILLVLSLYGFQSSSTNEPLSSCGHPAPHETCIACFSSWAHCWRSSHPLQRAMHGSKISH